MPTYTIISTSVSTGSDEAEMDLVVDEFSVEAEAVGYARRMADETRGMAEQLSLDFEYSNVSVYEGDLSEEEILDAGNPAMIGMWWYGEEGSEWATVDDLAATEGEAEEAAPSKAETH